MITKRYGKFLPLHIVNYCVHCFISPTYKSVFSFDLCCVILTSTKICHEVGGKDGGGGGLTNLSVHFLIKTIFPWLMIEITIKSVF